MSFQRKLWIMKTFKILVAFMIGITYIAWTETNSMKMQKLTTEEVHKEEEKKGGEMILLLINCALYYFMFGVLCKMEKEQFQCDVMKVIAAQNQKSEDDKIDESECPV